MPDWSDEPRDAGDDESPPAELIELFEILEYQRLTEGSEGE